VADPPPAPPWSGAAATAVAVILWGLGNVLVKHLAVDGLTLAVDRMWIGAVGYIAVFAMRGGRVSWRSLRASAVGGLCFAADIGMFFVALHHTSVADATVIGALQPALVLLVAGPVFGEVVAAAELLLSTVGILGVAVAVFGSAPTAGRTAFGDLLAVGALLAFTGYFVASKRARNTLGALEYQTSMLVVAAVAMTPVVVLSGHAVIPPHASDLGWAALVALVPGSGHLLVNWAHRATPIMVTSLLTLGTPVVSIAGAAVLLGEPLTALQVAGAVVALGGVAMVLARAAALPATASVAPDPAAS
jgi:drug/metabolite transporter (DMT)-like permease